MINKDKISKTESFRTKLILELNKDMTRRERDLINIVHNISNAFITYCEYKSGVFGIHDKELLIMDMTIESMERLGIWEKYNFEKWLNYDIDDVIRELDIEDECFSDK